MAQLVALMSGVVLGGVAEVVGSNLARGKIFTASIGSVDSLYPSVYIYIYIYIYIYTGTVQKTCFQIIHIRCKSDCANVQHDLQLCYQRLYM